MKVCGVALGEWANGGKVDVIWGVGPIVRNECEIWGQTYITLFQENEMSAGLHSRNLLLLLECLFALSTKSKSSPILLLCWCESRELESRRI